MKLKLYNGKSGWYPTNSGCDSIIYRWIDKNGFDVRAVAGGAQALDDVRILVYLYLPIQVWAEKEYGSRIVEMRTDINDNLRAQGSKIDKMNFEATPSSWSMKSGSPWNVRNRGRTKFSHFGEYNSEIEKAKIKVIHKRKIRRNLPSEINVEFSNLEEIK